MCFSGEIFYIKNEKELTLLSDKKVSETDNVITDLSFSLITFPFAYDVQPYIHLSSIFSYQKGAVILTTHYKLNSFWEVNFFA
jgi:hypothetical protein